MVVRSLFELDVYACTGNGTYRMHQQTVQSIIRLLSYIIIIIIIVCCSHALVSGPTSKIKDYPEVLFFC